MNVRREERGNLLAYIDNVRRNAKREAREKISRAQVRYVMNGGTAAYNKQNINILQATNKTISLVVKKRRYDDLWEDFMEYLDEDAIYSKKDLREQLDEALGKNKNFEDWREKKPGSFNNMTSRLTEGLIATGRAQEFLQEKNVEQITPERSSLYEKQVKNKEKFKSLVAQRKLYRVFNEQRKEQQLVYKTNKTWRDLNTGRFGTNPQKRIKQLMRD